LPRTGNGSLDGPFSLAGLLFLGGLFSLSVARRRRAVEA
jgi:LPXTG-motif cell wall-anchored protein